MDINRIDRFLVDNCLLNKHLPIVLALSGGPDSLCLFDVLRRLGYRMVILHVDHMLRPDSGEDAVYLQTFLATHGFSIFIERKNVCEFAHINRMSIEEAARQIRYRFLFEQARAQHAQAVTVAHTADDQVETVLMHILRGSGLAGLRGMSEVQTKTEWDKKIPLIRPLLGFWRSEVLDYCEQRGLKPRYDTTNLDTKYFRNRIRNELIPLLDTYNPRVKKAIWQMAQTIQGDDEVIQTAAEQIWGLVCLEQTEEYILFDAAQLGKLAIGLQRVLFRRSYVALGAQTENIGYEEVEKAVRFVKKPTAGKHIHLFSSIRLLMESNILTVTRTLEGKRHTEYPQIKSEIVIDPPETKDIGDDWVFTAEYLPDGGQRKYKDNKNFLEAFLDAKHTRLPLFLRRRRSGERFKPYGLQGKSMKITDLFINQKIPRQVRANYPLVCSGDEIIWIPGLRIAHGYQVDQSTHTLIHLRLEKRSKL